LRSADGAALCGTAAGDGAVLSWNNNNNENLNKGSGIKLKHNESRRSSLQNNRPDTTIKLPINKVSWNKNYST